MDIKCRRTTCCFNKGHTCCAVKVDITSKAVCCTYQKNNEVEEDDVDLSKHMFESAPEYANSRNIKNVCLLCNARCCLFNQEGKCRANGITVVDQNEESKGGSFILEL